MHSCDNCDYYGCDDYCAKCHVTQSENRIAELEKENERLVGIIKGAFTEGYVCGHIDGDHGVEGYDGADELYEGSYAKSYIALDAWKGDGE